MIKKLRIKFTVVITVIAALMLAGIFGTVLFFTKTNLEQKSIETMKEIAANPTRIGRPGEGRGKVELPYFAVIRTPIGSMISSGGYFDLSDENLIELLVNLDEVSQKTTGIINNYNLRYYRYDNGLQRVIVFTDVSSEIDTMRSLSMTCLMLFAGSLLLFALIGWLLSSWAAKPIEEAWNRQTQFVSDASHELKTPLTVIMTNAEMLSESLPDDSDNNKYADNILSMSKQMRGLVTGLLDLARADNGVIRKHFAPVQLSEAAELAVMQFEPICFENGKTLTSQIDDGITVNGNEQYLKQILDILLDNANKYADSGTEIILRLAKDSSHRKCVVTVESCGNEIPQEHLKDIFKRFYRCDEARMLNQSYGLGLSIADSIVKEHGGKIYAESGSGINRLIVELPTAG